MGNTPSNGAVVYSSQWTNSWVPPPDDCGGGPGDLDGSSFSISNLRISGSVVQGPEPTKCSGPQPAPGPAPPTPGGQCQTFVGMNNDGTNLRSPADITNSADECCSRCGETSGCVGHTQHLHPLQVQVQVQAQAHTLVVPEVLLSLASRLAPQPFLLRSRPVWVNAKCGALARLAQVAMMATASQIVCQVVQLTSMRIVLVVVLPSSHLLFLPWCLRLCCRKIFCHPSGLSHSME